MPSRSSSSRSSTSWRTRPARIRSSSASTCWPGPRPNGRRRRPGAACWTGGFNAARMRGVLESVREKSSWGTTRRRTARAWASRCHFSHAGYFAEVAEVAVDAEQAIPSSRSGWSATSAARSSIRATRENQVQGSVIEGDDPHDELGDHVRRRAARCRATSRTSADPHEPGPTGHRGRVRGSTDNPPPASASRRCRPYLGAIMNALFMATGERIRDLPLAKSGYRWT